MKDQRAGTVGVSSSNMSWDDGDCADEIESIAFDHTRREGKKESTREEKRKKKESVWGMFVKNKGEQVSGRSVGEKYSGEKPKLDGFRTPVSSLRRGRWCEGFCSHQGKREERAT